MQITPLRASRGLGCPPISGPFSGICHVTLLFASVLLAQLVLVPSWSGPAAAAKQDLEEVESALALGQARSDELARTARDLELEIRALRANAITLAREIQNRESELSNLEEELATLEVRRDAKQAELLNRREQMSATLAALQRMALRPADSLLAAPQAPVDTLRSGLLLNVTLPVIEAKATHLRGEVEELRLIYSEIAARRNDLKEAAASLESEQGLLRELITKKERLFTSTKAERDAERESVAALAAKAKDLRELFDKVEKELARRAAEREAARRRAAAEAAEKAAQAKAEADKARAEAEAARAKAEADKAQAEAAAAAAAAQAEAEAAQARAQAEADKAARAAEAQPAQTQVALLTQPPDIRPFPQRGASLVVPARGRIVSRFGQSTDNAALSQGIVIMARPGAQIVAPFDGKVVFSGEFRGYGLILIIEHGKQYHTLLAGFERIDAVLGQWVLAGEPVGLLSAGNADPKLYLELRQAGHPINPMPWLATSGDKVQG